MLYKIDFNNEYDSSDILFSIPIHERQDIINNQIENIMNYCPNCKIIFHINKNFKTFDKKYSEYNNVFFNSIQYNYIHSKGLIWIHINNFLEAIRLKINFKYFAIISSNEMFIKKGLNKYIEENKNGLQMIKYDENINWHNFKKGIEKNENMEKMLDELKLDTIYGGQTEGQFYQKNIFQFISTIYLKFFGYNELQSFETEEIISQTIFKSLNIKYSLPFTLQNYSNNISFNQQFISNILNNNFIIPDNTIKKNLFSPHINHDCTSIYSLKRIDRTFNPLRNYLTRKGFILNKEYFQLKTYYYSNGSSIYYKDHNIIQFKKYINKNDKNDKNDKNNQTDKNDKNNWFGFEIEEGYYYLNFHFKTNKNIIYNKNIGLKILLPNEIIYSYFFENCNVNEWYNVRFSFQLTEKQNVLFIFDDYNEELDIEFKNINFMSIEQTFTKNIDNLDKENIILSLYENPFRNNNDYNINYLNILKMVIEPFTKLYNVFILITSNNKNNLNTLVNLYQPFNIKLIEQNLSINNIFLKNIELINNFIDITKIPVKFTIFFSIDSIFKKSMKDFYFFINKFNFISYRIPYINNQISNSYDFMSIPNKHINYFKNLLEQNFNDKDICYSLYSLLKDNIDKNEFNFIYDDNYSDESRTPLINYLTDINNIYNNNGYLMNNKYFYNIYYQNNYSRILKNEYNEFYFYKTITNKYIPYQWIGIHLDYDNNNNKNIDAELIEIKIEFNIKLLKNIENSKLNYGLKIHEPLLYYKDWIDECELNLYKKIEINTKIYKKNQYIILNFDDYYGEIEFFIKDLRIIYII
jgi:hypothetical protein